MSRWRLRPRAILIPLLVAALLGLWMSWAAGTIMVRGHASQVAPAVPPARDLTIRTTDGVTLTATYRTGERDGAPAVLLLHGVDASRGALAANAEWLGRQGFATLTIDFRGHGGSTMAPRSFGLR